MQQPSAADSPAFRALDGSELLSVLVDHLDKAVYESLLSSGNRFTEGMSYPVASVHCLIRIGLYHDPRLPIPYKQIDVPLKLWTFVQPADGVPQGLKSVLSEEKTFHFDIGRSIESAPDLIREEHDLVVLQPQKTETGVIADVPVETAPKERKSGFRGASKRIKAEIEAGRKMNAAKR